MPNRRPARPHSLLLLVALLALTACKGKNKDKDKESEPSEPSGEAAPSSPMGSLGMMSALLANQVDQPGPYDELESSDGLGDDDKHIAVLELSGSISERQSFSLTGGLEGVELRALLSRLESLLSDEAVTGLLLRFGDLGIAPALAEELHGELLALRAAHPDKAISCHAEAVSTYTYWVMSACAAISLTPGGEVSIPGVSAVPMHLKGLLDRLGLKADFLHIGDYKGAAEPLTLEAPSAQSRETVDMILDEAFTSIVDAIASSRKLAPDEVRAQIDRAMLKADDALAAKLIDDVSVFADFRASLGAAWRLREIDERGNPTEKLLELIGMRPVPRPRGDRVALVYALGNVVDGHGAASQEVASRTLVAALEALGRDDDVKAVVLRISSPGGSALASEVIWNAISKLVADKPVVVSMGAVAASGGYYIAAPATRIFALGNTLTGSIGVVGGKVATSGGLDKLGIKTYPTGRGRHALLFASPEPWSTEERAVVRASMQAVYDQFAGRVRKGRGDIDDALMQGRVWTGKRALEHKLVDEIGGLNKAIAFARESAKLDANSPVEVYPPSPTLRDMLDSFGVSVRARLLQELELDPKTTRVVSGVASLIDGFAAQPIQAAMIFPVVLN